MDASKVFADALSFELAGKLHTEEISKIIEKYKALTSNNLYWF